MTEHVRPVEARVTVASVDSTFEQFVAEQQAALQNFAFLVIGNREDARDAVQDALVGACLHWGAARNAPGPYVRRSIANAHVSAWRKRRREVLVPEIEATGPAPAGPDTVWVQAMCRALPRKQRAAVVLAYYEDRTYDEIGGVLGCSSATARSLVSRGIAAMRRMNDVGTDHDQGGTR